MSHWHSICYLDSTPATGALLPRVGRIYPQGYPPIYAQNCLQLVYKRVVIYWPVQVYFS